MIEEKLRKVFVEEGLPFEEEKISALAEIHKMMCDYNEKINITAITEETASAKKHFADSLLPIKVAEELFFDGASCLDVGTGAGFPGLPLAVFLKNCRFTLIDSLAKKLAFTRSVKERLGLENVEIKTVRAEEFAREENAREKFDIVFSRAVANLSTLSELCLPFVKKGGCFLALKSREAEREIKEADFAVKELGGRIKALLGDSERNIVLIEKIADTPEKYPRRNGVPEKRPLTEGKNA